MLRAIVCFAMSRAVHEQKKSYDVLCSVVSVLLLPNGLYFVCLMLRLAGIDPSSPNPFSDLLFGGGFFDFLFLLVRRLNSF